jgi:hypothetical protein
VLESLGQIGRSSKKSGEAIGHKGIGFKSVLEVSGAPEVYSGLDGTEPSVALRFDAQDALRAIRQASPDWDEWLRDDLDHADDPLRAIPALRYPSWVEQPPSVVGELADQGFTTVVRLPFVGGADDFEGWSRRVHLAFSDVSDQILLLLGCFDRVLIDNRQRGDREEIVVGFQGTTPIAADSSREELLVSRNGVPSSRWVLYRRGVTVGGDLASETAVGVRLAMGEGSVPVQAANGAVPGTAEALEPTPFHLFFPTRIGSGLPFLPHGYFEVDAARTGFYLGSTEENNEILDELADLTATAVADLADREAVDLAALVELIAGTRPPEDGQARRFLDRVLLLLDDVAWIPTVAGASSSRARPTELLLGGRPVTNRIVETFPAAYVERMVALAVPDTRLSRPRSSFCSREAEGIWTRSGRRWHNYFDQAATLRGLLAKRTAGSATCCPLPPHSGI